MKTTIKNIALILFAAAALTMTSCSDESSDPTPVAKADTTYVLTKLVIHDGSDGGEGYDRTFNMTYDGKSLTKVDAVFGQNGVYGKFTSNFAYNTTNHTITRTTDGVAAVYTFSADSLLLSSTSSKFGYTAGNITSITGTNGNYAIFYNTTGIDTATVSNANGVYNAFKVKNTTKANSFSKIAPGLALTIMDETDFPVLHFLTKVNFSYLLESNNGIEYNYSSSEDVNGNTTVLKRTSVDGSIHSDITFTWVQVITK